ncbi:hypothetical protein VOI54_11040 [Tamlana sp. 2201CG12-4]|uniref:hypothetical protein n=1 Tax=Tamlana sp. 2201CG12-4 TaxID=3112582 RepID=UPI002DBF8012|nr:hypothetical protein [Tamlana sp. 2201CG12-4]MEC3907555.1 hypothetical protein [Tamlana sp. 2201CG12-4]
MRKKVMTFIKKQRKLILILILLGALVLLGLDIRDLLNNGISDKKITTAQLSELFVIVLLIFGLFWELYAVKNNKSDTLN